MISEVKKYKTADGREFSNFKDAEDWETEVYKAASGLVKCAAWLNKTGRYDYQTMVGQLSDPKGSWVYRGKQ